jgi:hypothetical protein
VSATETGGDDDVVVVDDDDVVKKIMVHTPICTFCNFAFWPPF